MKKKENKIIILCNIISRSEIINSIALQHQVHVEIVKNNLICYPL